MSATAERLPGADSLPPSLAIELCERGLVPDMVARWGMRKLMARRLFDESAGGEEARVARLGALVADLRSSPIAIETARANEQHYEVPAAFFHQHLGACLKYSCCFYLGGSESLDEAEQAMLELYVQRAGLADGQAILDLGCGWGSLSLWLAQRFPRARIVAISNSTGQREFIESRARQLGMANLRVITADINQFDFAEAELHGGFDRIVSIEMFEHMKNYAALLAKIARWLRRDGRLFVHIFAHRTLAYHFEVADQSDWMSQYFFTGGIMPSRELLFHFQDDLRVCESWWVNGQHYERTANQWLMRLDGARTQSLEILAQCYGEAAPRWLQRWRMFYMAVAELFGYRQGEEWGVAHYLFEKRDSLPKP